jgi:hypothetical protein
MLSRPVGEVGSIGELGHGGEDAQAGEEEMHDVITPPGRRATSGSYRVVAVVA